MSYKNIEDQRNRDKQRAKDDRLRRETDLEFAEKQRTQWRALARKKRERRGIEINERQRENYKNNIEEKREQIRLARHRREPTRGLASLIRDVRQGRRPPRDLVDALSTAIAKLNALDVRTQGKGIPRK